MFSAALGRVLDDTDTLNPAHPDNLRLDALSAALRDMVAHRPMEVTLTFAAVNQITLPIACYRIAAIAVEDDAGYTQFLSPTAIADQMDASSAESYWVWNGIIHLGAEYTSGSLYYHSYYPTMTVGIADIPVPVWAREAIIYRAAAHCLTPNLTSRARLGAYNDKQDASPIQNSLIQAADWFIGQFERIMAEHRQATGGY
jgi:hypothetical protein